MRQEILSKLEDDKKNYLLKLKSEFDNFDDYIDSKYQRDDADYYSNTLNLIILFKLMKHYDDVPDKIISFFEKNKLICHDYDILSKNPTNPEKCKILEEIRTNYIDHEYGKFIPTFYMLDTIYNHIKGKKVCILAENPKFLKYLFLNKYDIKISNYKPETDCDVLIFYQDKKKELKIDELLKKMILIYVMEEYDSYVFNGNDKYETDCAWNISNLSHYRNMMVIKEKNKKNEITIDDGSRPLLDYYIPKFQYYYDLGYYKDIKNYLENLIGFKIDKNVPNEYLKMLDYFSNIFFPEIKDIIAKNKRNGKNMVNSFYWNYIEYEYELAIPNNFIFEKIVNFIENKKLLTIDRGYGFWPYLFKSHGIDTISTFNRKNISKASDVPVWSESEDIEIEDAFIKYKEAEVLFIPCIFEKNIKNIDNFKGKYVIIISEPSGPHMSFYIRKVNKRYKILENYSLDYMHKPMKLELIMYQKMK